jgi:hypothetical protein
MFDVVFGKSPAFAVFEPFLADLIAADVEVPDILRYTSEKKGTEKKGTPYLIQQMDFECSMG